MQICQRHLTKSDLQLEEVDGFLGDEGQAAMAELKKKMKELAAAEASAEQRSSQAESSSKDGPDELQLANVVDRHGLSYSLKQ